MAGFHSFRVHTRTTPWCTGDIRSTGLGDQGVVMSGGEAVGARVGMGEEEGRQGVVTLRSWLNKSMKVGIGSVQYVVL